MNRATGAAAGNWRPVLVFVGLTFAISSVYYVLIIHRTGMSLAPALMWSPGIAAIITTLVFRRRLAELGWQWGKWRYQGASWLVPLLYSVPAYLLVWFSGLGGFYDQRALRMAQDFFGTGHSGAVLVLLTLFLTLTLSAGVGAVFALGEEIGWRGFLVPELMKHTSLARASFITGGIWAVWHWPLIWFAEYNAGTPVWFGTTCFTVLLVSISFIYAWLRMKSGSLWTAVWLHAVHNAIIQGFLTPMTVPRRWTPYFIDEFGVAMLPFTVAFAIYFWRRRGEVERQA